MKSSIILLLLLVMFYGCDVKQSSDNVSEEEIAKNVRNRLEDTISTKKAIEQSNRIKYEVVKRWSVPSGGSGKLVLVSPSLFNEKDLTALGKKLKSDAGAENFSIVFVYDNRDAINLYNQYTKMQTSAKEDDFYEKHLIAQYSKNMNTGHHEFNIYMNGYGSGNFKTIKY